MTSIIYAQINNVCGRPITSQSPVSSEYWSPIWSCIARTRCVGLMRGVAGSRLRRCLSITAILRQRVPCCALDRMPRGALPSGAGRARRRVLHPRRVEGRAPSLLVVPRELEIETLPRHADGDVSNAGPRVEPGAQRVERAVVRRRPAPGEAERCHEESAALVEHGYWITWSARGSSEWGTVMPRVLAVLRLMTSSNFVGCSMGKSAGLAPLRTSST